MCVVKNAVFNHQFWQWTHGAFFCALNNDNVKWMLMNISNSLEQSSSWESVRWWASKDIEALLLWNPKVYYRIHKSLPRVPILNQTKVILKFSIPCISDQGICLLKQTKHIISNKINNTHTMLTSTQLAPVHNTSQAPGHCPLWIENHTRYLNK